MASDFLKNLQNSVETGEFNSEAAKKIIAIDKLADTKDVSAVEEKLKNIESPAITVTPEEAALLNSEYEKKMADIKKQDAANAELAILIDIEDMVKASIGDMVGFVDDIINKFPDELGGDTVDPMFAEVRKKIDEINAKYKPIIN